jgi:hypothetical protein
MKSIKNWIFLFIFAAFIASCSSVPVGHVGVKVYLYGGDKGVNDKVLPVGRYWIGINENLYIFPTYQINYVYTQSKTEGSPENEEFTFQTKEGMECSMDLGLSMHFDPEKNCPYVSNLPKGRRRN